PDVTARDLDRRIAQARWCCEQWDGIRRTADAADRTLRTLSTLETLRTRRTSRTGSTRRTSRTRSTGRTGKTGRTIQRDFQFRFVAGIYASAKSPSRLF